MVSVGVFSCFGANSAIKRANLSLACSRMRVATCQPGSLSTLSPQSDAIQNLYATLLAKGDRLAGAPHLSALYIIHLFTVHGLCTRHSSLVRARMHSTRASHAHARRHTGKLAGDTPRRPHTLAILPACASTFNSTQARRDAHTHFPPSPSPLAFAHSARRSMPHTCAPTCKFEMHACTHSRVRYDRRASACRARARSCTHARSTCSHTH
eukprot:6180709-Pleurochrysis_carterae.AAC.2